jgi:hypothetical protein
MQSEEISINQNNIDAMSKILAAHSAIDQVISCFYDDASDVEKRELQRTKNGLIKAYKILKEYL